MVRAFIGGFVFTSVLTGCTVNIVRPSPPVATSAPTRPLINPCGMVNCNRPDTRRIA